LIGVVIFAVVVFIIVRFVSRSNYKYPNTAELSEYIISGYSSTAAVGGGSPTPAYFTITTSAQHNIAVGDIIIIYGHTGTITPGAGAGFTSPSIASASLPAGVALPAGGVAAWVYTVPTSTTVTVMGTQTTASGGKLQAFGYQPMTAMITSDTTCQNQYAFDLLDSTKTPKVFTSSGAAQTLSSSSTTINTATALSVSNGDKVTIVGANSPDGTPAFLIVSGSTSSAVTFTSASITNATTGITGGSASILGQSSVANITQASNTRNTCIATAASTYTYGHCKYLPPSSGPGRSPIPSATDDTTAAAAYNTYVTDMTNIQRQYALALTRAQNNIFPSGGALQAGSLTSAQQVTIVQAARKADLAGVTRRYLAIVCPGFYAPADSVNNADQTSTYKTWLYSTAGSKPNSGTGFWVATDATTTTGGIPDADIMIWAKYSGAVTYNGPVTGITVNTGGSGYATAPTVIFTPSGATATATVVAGVVTVIAVAGGGSYSSAPTITFSGGTGIVSGTTATIGVATIAGGKITGYSVNTPGSGYTPSTSISITPPTNTAGGGTIVGNIGTGGTLTSITVSAGGLSTTGTAWTSANALVGVVIPAPPAAVPVAPTATAVIAPTLAVTASILPASVTGFTPTGGSLTSYSSTAYSTGNASDENWRKAYYNGPGTYPTQTMA